MNQNYVVTVTRQVTETFAVIAPDPQAAVQMTVTGGENSRSERWYKNNSSGEWRGTSRNNITCVTVEDRDGDIVHREGVVAVPLEF